MSERDLFSTRRALLSVSDKTGIVEFAQALAAQGIEILSTGGTARLLREHGIAVIEVSDYTGFPEIMDGRLKTLHPKVHGGLLGRREKDRAAMTEHGIGTIDLLAVNLYPFEQTISRAGVTFEEGIENVDIGGPAMIRAASKNHERVAVVVDPADYATVARELREHDGDISQALRSQLAVKAFRRTAAYDASIARWLAHRSAEGGDDDEWPGVLAPSFERVSALRYGENPHQRAAFYADGGGGLAGAEQLQGKALSYNNIADASVAYECVCGFETPACVIVKHATPCGAACATTLERAYVCAAEADPVSAFGGVIAFNRPLDAATARVIVQTQFAEVIIAPEVAKDALEALSGKAALRVLVCAAPTGGRRYCSVLGGVLVQEADSDDVSADTLTVMSKRRPRKNEIEDLLFAWRVAEFVKSNAIVLARDTVTTGIGGGQTSRVDSVRLAVEKAVGKASEGDGKSPVMASDAFFPFRDGIDAAAEAGVTAVIQPGGSKRDEEVIAAADEHDIAMVFTGVRHFRH